jgi:SNF2 family DNA or RNA helicase
LIPPLHDFDRIRKPWDHQEEALRRAYTKTNFGLFLIARSWMYRRQTGLKILVVSPPITLKNWQNEWLAASKLTPKSCRIASGHYLQRVNVFKDPQTLVAITNYESLNMQPVVDAIEAFEPGIIIYDESHRIKNPQAKRAKAAWRLSKMVTCKHRLIMTGTPVLNTPMDLFSQFRAMDNGAVFGTNFSTFRYQYFVDKNSGMPIQNYFPDWRIREGAIQEINSVIKDNTMYISKDECLDLPPLVKKTIDVELSPEQRKLYASMAKDFLVCVELGVSVARLALTKALRLQQIITGFLTVEGENGENTNYKIKENPRASALSDLLEDISGKSKVIVWACFKENYDTIRTICSSLSIEYVELHGEIGEKDKFLAVDRFNTDPNVRVCIGHPGSGGIGINLIAADSMVFFSRTWNLEYDLQAEARNYRGGSEIHKKITRYDIVSPGTIDELILTKLHDKQGVSDAVLLQSIYDEVSSEFGRRLPKGSTKRTAPETRAISGQGQV